MYFDLSLIPIPGARLMSAAMNFSRIFAASAPHPSSDFTLALFAIFAGIACACLGFWMHPRLEKRRPAVRPERSRQDQSLPFHSALLGNSGQALVVLETDIDFGGGNMLLQKAMAGPDAPAVAHALHMLLHTGQSFERSARTEAGGVIGLRGLPIGHRAVVYLQDRGPTDPEIRFREILDALPAPVWIRGQELSLRWGNRAFLDAVGAGTMQDAIASNAALDRSENDLAAAVLENQAPLEARRFAVVGGQRRTLAINLLPLPDAGVAGIAIDMSEVTRADAGLRQAAEEQADMLERLPLGIAIFDAGQRLAGYNRNYAQFWGLSEAWLDTHPSHGEILNRLRETRQLPEQRDFAAWNQDQLRAFARGGHKTEESWHLPGGRSVRIMTQPHLRGGIFVLFEDITERLRLETSLNLLTQVQKATLDTLDEGIAIFGTDGRLVLHNAYFAALWRLTEDELSGQPHIADIAGICDARIGHDTIWSVVSAGVTSMEQQRRGKWGKARRADGRVISLSISRLPNGATIVTFMDLTDLERFEALQRESLPDQASADIKANRNPR